MEESLSDMSDEQAQTIAIDEYTREIEEIADMLDALKDELERKERLLIKVEETLEDTEKILEKKIQSIVDKDEKLKKIEDILKRKEEDMHIQEEELQTNAALEYLSFRAREDEIAEKMNELTEKERKIDVTLSLEEIDAQIKEREEFLKEIEKHIDEKKDEAGPSGALMDPKIMEELERREQEITKKAEDMESLEERFMQMEDDIRDREENIEIQARKLEEMARALEAQQASMATLGPGPAEGGGGPPSPELLKAVEKKESEIQHLRNLIKSKDKETSDFKKQLEELEIQLKEREEEVKYRETELNQERERLEAQLGMDKSELAQVVVNEQEMKYQIEKELKRREREITEKVQRKADLRTQPLMKKIELLTRRNEELEGLEDNLEGKGADLEMREMQLRERFEEISYAEEKLSKREQRLMHERMSLEEDRKKMRATGGGSSGDLELMEEEIRLKNEELAKLEENLAERESFLREKELEMKRMGSKLIDADLDMEIAVEKEKDVAKIKTGVRRLDDLFYGGLPLNCNVFVYGPPFTGKLVLLDLFIAEGLAKGIPGIFILTDKTPKEIRESIRPILPKIEVYEKKGLLKFVDAYSRNQGIDTEEPNTTYVEKPTDLEEISIAVTNVQKEIEKDHKYHKLALHSVSTIMAYTDAMTTFRFLQNLTSRNKRAGAISLYCMDEGMFSDSDVQTLKHLMNGIIEFEVKDLKSFLRVEGICDVRTRGSIEYTHSTKNILLKGSFAVDHIR